MTDTLYLSLWFHNFRLQSVPDAVRCVLRQVTPSAEAPGVRAASVYALTWSGPQVYQRIYDAEEFGEGGPEEIVAQQDNAVRAATESLHDDYAYEFEVYTDLWLAPDSEGEHWNEQPALLRVTAFGPSFEDAAYEQNGHIRIEIANDSPFLYNEDIHVPEAMMRVQQNVARLLDLTARIEKNCGVTSRLLWSEGEDDLAQKLVKQLQRLN